MNIIKLNRLNKKSILRKFLFSFLINKKNENYKNEALIYIKIIKNKMIISGEFMDLLNIFEKKLTTEAGKDLAWKFKKRLFEIQTKGWCFVCDLRVINECICKKRCKKCYRMSKEKNNCICQEGKKPWESKKNWW